MKDNGIKYGVLAGLGIVFFMLIFYAIDKKLMLNTSIDWSTILIVIAGMSIAGIEDLKRNKGELPFKAILKTTFVVWILSTGIYYIFQYIIFKYIDPGLLDIQKEVNLDRFENPTPFIKFFLTEEGIKAMIESIKIESPKISFSNKFNKYTRELIGGFIISVIVSLILKRINR